MAKINEAPMLSDAVKVLSTAGYLYISADANPDLKTLKNATSNSEKTGMLKIAKFKSGTFSFDGEAPTITPLTYEDGTTYYATSSQGSESITGEIPDLSENVMKFLMGATDVNVSTGYEDSILQNAKILATGKTAASLDNRVVFLEFTQGGAYDWMMYPNAKIVTSKGGSGSADGTVSLVLNISANVAEGSSVPADIQGNNILWGKYNE